MLPPSSQFVCDNTDMVTGRILYFILSKEFRQVSFYSFRSFVYFRRNYLLILTFTDETDVSETQLLDKAL
jgi:uncharacterized membrane protein